MNMGAWFKFLHKVIRAYMDPYENRAKVGIISSDNICHSIVGEFWK